MTRDEILNMPAGKEMDALIAEKVMGWHRHGSSWHDDAGYCAYNEQETWEPHFEPSRKIEDAWEVVEKLCNETGCDVVKVCKRDPELLRGEWSCNFGRGFEAFGDTATLAICRAALMAVMEP
jgi:hypothetical protein